MKLETLRKLWQDKNPGGNVWYAASNGALSDVPAGKSKKFAVNFKADGKLYTYTAASIYALAERFELIPDSNVDYWAESRAAISAMDAGESYTSLGGLWDTIHYILEEQHPGMSIKIDGGESGKDEYDRRVFTFSAYEILDPKERWYA